MKLAVCCLLIFIMVPVLGQGQVNGLLSEAEGKTILKVWGTHYERGYAQGYLLSNRILSIMNEYFYQGVCGNSSTTYNYLLNYFNTRFLVEDQFQSEATGIMEGISQAGQSLYHNGLQRNLTPTDLLMINAIVDMSPLRREFLGRDDYLFACSSLSSWGLATAADATLQGALVHTRFMDWTPHPSLIANPLLIVHNPSEPTEQAWASFTYPGLMGALSAFNSQNSAAFLNMGNSHGGSNYTQLKHVLLCIREALEQLDYNGDGEHSHADLEAALINNRFRAGTIIHAMWDSPELNEPAIYESNNYGLWTRTQAVASGLPVDHLAATNHFRLMIEPAYCYRYTNLINALHADSLLGAEEQYTLLSTAAGVTTNLMAIQYIPSLHKVSWATAETGVPAYQNQLAVLDTDELFSFPTATTDPELSPAASAQLFPNPLRRGEQLQLKSESPLQQVALYNLRGQLLWQNNEQGTDHIIGLPNQAAGIYLLQITDQAGKNSLQKLLVLP